MGGRFAGERCEKDALGIELVVSDGECAPSGSRRPGGGGAPYKLFGLGRNPFAPLA